METHDYGNTIDSNNNKHTGNKSDDDIISTQCHHWYTSELLIDNKRNRIVQQH